MSAAPTDSLAKVRWASRKTDDFSALVSDFLAKEPYGLRQEPAPNGRGKLFVFEVREQPPEDMVHEAGAIMHAQRSALDTLVYELAERAGHTNPQGTSFPIVRDSQDPENAARGRLKLLDPRDRDLILSTQPYAEGNPTLYALHRMNIEDKHKRLPISGVWPGGEILFSGSGHIGLFTFFSGPFYDGNPVAQLEASEEISFRLQLFVGLADHTGSVATDAVGFLKACTDEVTRIIGLFN